MRAIFISYRRDDASGEAGRLFDDLTAKFGSDRVFMDVSGIEPGRDFRKVIDENVASCGVLLAVIGKGWIDAKDEHGHRRLDDPSDFVRLETGSALKRDVIVIPVLVRGAAMPRADQLPEDLKELAYRNGVELTHARWGSDVELLVKALRAHLADLPGPSSKPDQAATARGDQPSHPVVAQWVSSGTGLARRVLSSRRAVIATAAVLLVTALTLYLILGNEFTISNVDSRDSLVANGKQHDVLVEFKAGKHEVKEIDVKYVGGDVPASSWTAKVSSEDNKLGRASVGPISYRSQKETTVTFQYVLVAADGTRSKPYPKTFKLAAGIFQPPSISTVQVPNVMHVGQPYSFRLWYEAPDADVVQVQRRIVESSVPWPQSQAVYPLKAARGTGSLTYNLPASQTPYKTTEEFVLIDAFGNRSQPHRTSFEVLPATATAQNVERTRPQQGARGVYGNASCFNCAIVIAVREVPQASGAATAGAVMGGLLGGAIADQGRRGQSSNAAVAAGAFGAMLGQQAAGSASRVYEITVRYEDGRSEVIRQSTAPRWRNGDRVQVVNGALRYAA